MAGHSSWLSLERCVKRVDTQGRPLPDSERISPFGRLLRSTSLDELPPGRSDIKLLLIGNGKLKAGLQARAAAERLDNVVFHDPVNKARLAGLMQSTDLGMQILANVPAFYYGSSPNKFFDYIAAGLPVLNNYPGWLAGMIETQECGYAVPPADPKAFADALERAAAERDRLKAMGNNSRALAEREFDRDKLSEKWVGWLEDAYREASH